VANARYQQHQILTGKYATDMLHIAVATVAEVNIPDSLATA